MKSLVSFQSIDIGYKRKIVLQKISFQIRRGEKISLIGPNGAGKTTLIKVIMGLKKPVGGQLSIDHDILFGYSPQRAVVNIMVPLTVEEYITLDVHDPRVIKTDMGTYWCERMKLTPLLQQPFSSLSGGQKQRALVLRALLKQPDFLILDEPVDNLDIQGCHMLLNIIDEYCEQHNATLILISHALNSVINHTQRLMIIKNHTLIDQKLTKNDNLQTSLSTIFSTDVAVETFNGKRVIIS